MEICGISTFYEMNGKNVVYAAVSLRRIRPFLNGVLSNCDKQFCLGCRERSSLVEVRKTNGCRLINKPQQILILFVALLTGNCSAVKFFL
jgi:hypothetical protein